MDSMSEIRPLLTEMREHRSMTGGTGSGGGGGGCRSSLILGGSSGGRGSSGGKGSGGRSVNKSSNSGSKKKAGWEDAELEFYKEAYPMPASDTAGLSQCQHLATLLPSTRYHVNTMGRGSVHRRRRRSVRSRSRRRGDGGTLHGGTIGLAGTAGANATWVRTGRRGSDTYLEVMPDLTQGVDEEQTWLELQQVRCQPVPLQEKRKLKRQLLAAPTLRTRGWQTIHLTRRKLSKRVRERVREFLARLELWHSRLRYVEGNFGTGLVALFTFIKWLLFLNIFMSAVIALFIVVPQYVFMKPEDPCVLRPQSTIVTPLSTTALPSAGAPTQQQQSLSVPSERCCHLKYRESIDRQLKDAHERPWPDKIKDYLLLGLQGTGELEYSPIFYGFYDNQTMTKEVEGVSLSYRLPVAYLSVMLLLLAFCLLVMVMKAAQGLRESLRSTEGEFYQFCNLIFGGWDFCIENTKASGLKHRAIYHEFCRHLEAERFREEKEQRTRKERACLFLVRVLVNVVVFAILGGSIYLVFCVTQYSFKELGFLSDSASALRTARGRRETRYVHINNATLMPALAGESFFYDTQDFPERDFYEGLLDNSTSVAAVAADYGEDAAASFTTAHTIFNNVITNNDISHSLPTSYGTSFMHNNININGFNGDGSGDLYNTVYDNRQSTFVPTHNTVAPPTRSLGKSLSGSEHNTLSEEHRPPSTTTLRDLLSVDPSGGIITTNTIPPGVADNSNPVLAFVFQYLPSATIITLNVIVPMFFNRLVVWERYNTALVLRITLFRTVLLRLVSLGVLLYALRDLLKCSTQTPEQCDSTNCTGQLLCWETHVGQELYKLTILDLVVMIITTFVVNLLRKVLGQHVLRRTALGKRVGAVEFEIPKHVLDIVYGQTLCWLGMFYAPLLPAITCVKLVLVFYIKYFDCSINGQQSSQFYRTSRSNALFISILLVSFIVTMVPVGFSIVEITPSVACGPFRGLPNIWAEMVAIIAELPSWVRAAVFFLGTAGFAVPTIVLLCLATYYYYAVAAANKHLVELLKGQLVLEGHDKQFLLNRLDQMIKRANEEEERSRRNATSTEYSDVSAVGSNDLTLQIG